MQKKEKHDIIIYNVIIGYFGCIGRKISASSRCGMKGLNELTDRITFLGVRGSIPQSGADYIRYGGATVCVFLRLAGETVVLDAGSGMTKLPGFLMPEEKHLTLLLSHPHADHLLGFLMCPLCLDPAYTLNIYGAVRSGLTVREQLERLMSPPIWPVRPQELAASVNFYDLPEQMTLGGVTVECMEGRHPGGVSLLRLSGGGKTVVFATDVTLGGELSDRFAEFAGDCDLLIIDGQYSDAEWEKFHSFGHTPYTAAAAFGKRCGAKRTRIIHHAPVRTDDMLDAAAAELTALNETCAFSREGEEILL